VPIRWAPADIHYVVTEYGVAYLHGKNVQERALALISIAHPDFRGELLKEAIDAKYVRKELARVGNRVGIAPEETSTTLLLDDGTQINFRPVHLTDEPLMKELLRDLSRETLYYRFMSQMKWVPKRQIQEFVYIDHRNEVSIVGTVPEAHGEDIIALGGYYLDSHTNRAEIAFIVKDEWQNRGIGSFMLRYLTSIAKQHSIEGFTAEVLQENKRMQTVFHNSDLNVRSNIANGIYSYVLDFA